MAEYKIPLLCITGPTASGKTGLGVEICKKIGGEVVSCDSMQIYKGMDIATAKPTKEEMQGVPHHLIDFVDPCETYSVARYCDDAKAVINDINARGKVPVLVGGTGLYYSSLTENLSFFEEETDFEYRNLLKSRAEKEGPEVLYEELKIIDPTGAEKLHINNLGRVIRALEIYHTTGRTITEQNEHSREVPSPYDVHTICLDASDRQFLYDRINRRVDIMLEMGLEAEAKTFFESEAGRTAVQAIGYKELKPYFDNLDSFENCIENLKMQTRRYAKRQLTWFRRYESIQFINIDTVGSEEELIRVALSKLDWRDNY